MGIRKKTAVGAIALALLTGVMIVSRLPALPASAQAADVSLENESVVLTVKGTVEKPKAGKSTVALKTAKGVKVKSIAYKTLDNTVAKVSKSGVIKAKMAGNTKVTVKVTYQKDGKSKTSDLSVAVKVKDKRKDFYISPITDKIFARIKGKSFKDNCTLKRKELRYLHVLHKDVDGKEHEGEMIVNYHIANDVLEILKELYDKDYPIEKIRLVDEYDADDETSMRDNNSSAFNFRFISHTTTVSKHGLGMAVDINTLYNPYIKYLDDGTRVLEPATAEKYLDRDADFDYKIVKGDDCYNAFIKHGFEWGGEWTTRKDYQHFEIPDNTLKKWY